MAAGEYISVASQRDAELADVATEAAEQAKGPAARAAEPVTRASSRNGRREVITPYAGIAARHQAGDGRANAG